MSMVEDKQENGLIVANDCEWIRGLDANGNSIRINKTDLASIFKEYLGVIERVLIPSGEDGNTWYRIMEFDNNSNSLFILCLMAFANASQSLLFGHASIYNSVSICYIKQIIGNASAAWNPDVRYKAINNKLIIWSKGGHYVKNYIYILRGMPSAFPMIAEPPPEDAITPIY